MAARTIDPATGASTWALGSQRWTVNIGSLTRNARKTRTVSKFQEYKQQGSKGKVRRIRLKFILKDPSSLAPQIIISNRGRDAATVYTIIYIPAWSRSGWYPQPKISIRVGMRDASNIK